MLWTTSLTRLKVPPQTAEVSVAPSRLRGLGSLCECTWPATTPPPEGLAAAVAPEVGSKCALAGGLWYSSYDDEYVSDARSVDIDHMVPLAEAWDSGAFAWTAKRREDYANDLDEPRSLRAVTARSNRSKADQDPSAWLPPYAAAQCGYITDWVSVKTRWGLTADGNEKAVLAQKAASCPNVPIAVDIA